MRYGFATLFTITMFAAASASTAEDWPMWRHNSGRTGISTGSLPDSTSLAWARDLPAIEPAFHNERLQFDAGYEPVVAGGKVLIASSKNDSVTAYDSDSGRESWTFRTNGPVRLAPAVWENSVCFGSDDGCLYCGELTTGELRWKHRAVSSNRTLLGNRRLISVWPVRGGPVVAEGIVYFAAGVWPFEGIFIYAMNIESGKVVWRNDRMGYLFGQQPHNTEAIGGLAPQGYLVVNGDELVVPCSTAYPARLNRHTGELIEFELPGPGRLPGGWFATIDDTSARAIRRGKLTFDDVINKQLHEDKVNKGPGVSGISREIRIGDKTLKFDDGYPGVAGTIHSMATADVRLFVTTREGQLYCFATTGESKLDLPKHWELPSVEVTTTPESARLAKQLIAEADSPRGYAFVVGLSDGALTRAILLHSQFHVVAVDSDHQRIEKLRRELEATGLYGSRVSIIEGSIQEAVFPPYLASLITTETPDEVTTLWERLLPSLRPFGGIAAPRLTNGNDVARLTDLVKSAPDRLNNFELADSSDQNIVRRVGALPGTSNYGGDWKLSPDELVRFPLGVLWFDDTLAHFKRSPQPQFNRGVMISRPKDWHAPREKGVYTTDYPLLPTVLSDIYTGRVLEETEQTGLRATLPLAGTSKPEPSQYRPPGQKDMWKPVDPVIGERTNPLTGEKEPRVFPKTYGCDGGVDYGSFYTLRSGTAAFYDKTIESGTVFLSGPRSGCTNSIIPAGGVLNVPYFFEGCTCSYPLPTAMSLVSMPENHEQWSSWGSSEIKPKSIQRIGLNFGAPGDRMTREGTLWLDHPSVGGPSPQIKVETTPAAPMYRYRHSVWMSDGEGWPWVAASAAEGLSQIRLHDLKPGRYTVRLYFAELDDGKKSGDRLQTATVQGNNVLANLDIATEAGTAMRGIVRQIDNVDVDDVLTIDLKASAGKTLISGVELVRNQ
jgi:outer membrane protein assembly factor BamB